MTNKSVISIKVFENKKEKLFFSSSVSERKRLVYYTTVHSLLRKLFKSSLSVKPSFNKRRGLFTEIRSKKTATYHTTATLQHPCWYVQINNKRIINNYFINYDNSNNNWQVWKRYQESFNKKPGELFKSYVLHLHNRTLIFVGSISCLFYQFYIQLKKMPAAFVSKIVFASFDAVILIG